MLDGYAPASSLSLFFLFAFDALQIGGDAILGKRKGELYSDTEKHK